jgi:flavodoxin
MKALVVFYSRSGNTRKAAEAIAEATGCDLEEIVDKKSRSGPLGYLLAGRDALFRMLTSIRESQKDPSIYDLVIVGTPVWSFTLPPPVRAYLSRHKDELRKAAFFCTHGGSGGKGAFGEMERLCGKKPEAVLEIKENEVAGGTYVSKARGFAKKIMAASRNP